MAPSSFTLGLMHINAAQPIENEAGMESQTNTVACLVGGEEEEGRRREGGGKEEYEVYKELARLYWRSTSISGSFSCSFIWAVAIRTVRIRLVRSFTSAGNGVFCRKKKTSRGDLKKETNNTLLMIARDCWNLEPPMPASAINWLTALIT
ncbi:hypothetical protein EYF80_033954 [Liparis tanakae]|uniref:Uncharacterized protein n=1 Tax=Liparis tanakae TaxID=230148 RepID=A0A4Z2GST1_9TELE|nr:hypothetical protein EYF80_033954 [Liparis tanakae]